MFNAKEAYAMRKKVEEIEEDLRTKAMEGAKKMDGMLTCIHLSEGEYTASIWEFDEKRKYEESGKVAKVTNNDISGGENLNFEQKEYIKDIQLYLIKINKSGLTN